MQIKQSIARFLLKQLGPQYAAALNYTIGGRLFTWNNTDTQAYKNKIVYSALNILVPKLIETPVLVNKQVKSNRQKRELHRYYSKSISNEQRRLIQVKALEELENHPLIDLLNSPNDYQTGLEMMEAFWFNYEFGDGYIFAEFPDETSRKAGQPVALHSLNRSRVEPLPAMNRFGNTEYYRISLFDGSQITVPASDMFHLRKWSPDGDGKGFGIIEPAGKSISKNEENQIAQGAAFSNGGRGTIVSSDIGSDKDNGLYNKMPSEEIDKLRRTVNEDWAGSTNNRKIHFTNGYLNVQSYGDTLAEMELIDADKADWHNIFAIFGIPVALAPTEAGITYDNVNGMKRNFITDNIIPKLRKFDVKFAEWCKGWYPEVVIPTHDLTAFEELSPNVKEMVDTYVNKGLLTKNEERRLIRYDDINEPYMDEMYIPAGFVTLRSIGEAVDYIEPGSTEDYR